MHPIRILANAPVADRPDADAAFLWLALLGALMVAFVGIVAMIALVRAIRRLSEARRGTAGRAAADPWSEAGRRMRVEGHESEGSE